MLVVVLFIIAQGLAALAWNTHSDTGTTLLKHTSRGLVPPDRHYRTVELIAPHDFRLSLLKKNPDHFKVDLLILGTNFYEVAGGPRRIKGAYASGPVKNNEIAAARAVKQLYFSTTDKDGIPWAFFRLQVGYPIKQTTFKSASSYQTHAACYKKLMEAADVAAKGVEQYYKKYHWLHMNPEPQSFQFGRKLEYATPVDWAGAVQILPHGFDFKQDARWGFAHSKLCPGPPEESLKDLKKPSHRR